MTTTTTTAAARALHDCLGSADARFLALCSGASDDSARVLALLDAFFQRATQLQTHREQLHALARDATAALHEETRLVFLFYMRVLALLRKRAVEPAPQLLDAVLHVTRVAPFCQLYARSNASSVAQLVHELVEHVDGFAARVDALRGVYLKHLNTLHASVQQDKRSQVLELIHSVYDVALSLSGLVTSPSLVPLLLLGAGNEPELVFQTDSLLRALVVCYESDVPMLQRHLSKLDDDKAQDKTLVIAETRRLLLEVLGRFMDELLTKQGDGLHDEVLLEVLHTASHCCDDEHADQGSYLSDLWYLCGYKDKIASFLESGETASDHVSYLEMIVDALPRRRIVSPGMASRPGASASAVEDTASATALSGASDAPTAMQALVHQVQDLFPDLGDGYIELCLLSASQQLETVINFLLESNPPPALLDAPRDLKRSDPAFAALEAQLNGKVPATPAGRRSDAASEAKLDPSRVWIGKKPMAKHYDPQLARQDAAVAAKTKTIATLIVDEEEVMAGLTPFLKLDEYDDDYNDEFEDYEPFSVHDGGQTDDQDTIRERNRLLLAREAEDAFWESMRNRNHMQPTVTGDAIDEDAEQKLVPNAARAGPRRATPAQQQQQSASSKQPSPGADATTTSKKKNQNGQQHPTSGKKTGGGAGGPAADAAPLTKEQELRARARSAKNKAKVGNHHRKERALKKQG